MTSALIALIESRIRERLSPEQISGWLLTEREDLISHETIYRHIWADQRHGGEKTWRRKDTKETVTQATIEWLLPFKDVVGYHNG